MIGQKQASIADFLKVVDNELFHYVPHNVRYVAIFGWIVRDQEIEATTTTTTTTTTTIARGGETHHDHVRVRSRYSQEENSVEAQPDQEAHFIHGAAYVSPDLPASEIDFECCFFLLFFEETTISDWTAYTTIATLVFILVYNRRMGSPHTPGSVLLLLLPASSHPYLATYGAMDVVTVPRPAA